MAPPPTAAGEVEQLRERVRELEERVRELEE
jgi:polyhydroxyalkanoate synthesis regulator phasin